MSDIKVLCLLCKDPVGKRQQAIGKAFCTECEEEIFINKFMGKVFPFERYLELQKKQKEDIFVNMMKNVFRRMRF